MMRPAGAVLSLAFLLPAVAFAQAKGGTGDRPGTSKWHEVERGLYATGTFGMGIVLNPPVTEGATSPMSMGLSMGVAAGVDLGSRVQLEAFVNGAQVNAPPSYVGLGGPTDPRGDFSSLIVGGKLRVAFLKFADIENIDRFFVAIEGGGGLSFSEPGSVFAERRPTVLGGLALRYYTRMRHFSVGLDLDAAYALGIETLSVIPQLALSYTF